jgi:hypothetical protein
MTKEDDRPPLGNLFETKRQLIAKNQADLQRRLKRSPTRVLWVCACCHCALDDILRSDARSAEGRYCIFDSGTQPENTVTKEQVKAAAALLRHPGMGYPVRVATRRHQGRETYRIYYYHSYDL